MKQFFAHDDFVFGLLFQKAFDMYSPLTSSYTFRGQFVDTDKFDIVPKQSYYDEQIKHKEEEIESNERDHKASTLYYEERKRKLLEEKDNLLGRKNYCPAGHHGVTKK